MLAIRPGSICTRQVPYILYFLPLLFLLLSLFPLFSLSCGLYMELLPLVLQVLGSAKNFYTQNMHSRPLSHSSILWDSWKMVQDWYCGSPVYKECTQPAGFSLLPAFLPKVENASQLPRVLVFQLEILGNIGTIPRQHVTPNSMCLVNGICLNCYHNNINNRH